MSGKITAFTESKYCCCPLVIYLMWWTSVSPLSLCFLHTHLLSLKQMVSLNSVSPRELRALSLAASNELHKGEPVCLSVCGREHTCRFHYTWTGAAFFSDVLECRSKLPAPVVGVFETSRYYMRAWTMQVYAHAFQQCPWKQHYKSVSIYFFH